MVKIARPRHQIFHTARRQQGSLGVISTNLEIFGKSDQPVVTEFLYPLWVTFYANRAHASNGSQRCPTLFEARRFVEISDAFLRIIRPWAKEPALAKRAFFLSRRFDQFRT
jgi:hypothetical protein